MYLTVICKCNKPLPPPLKMRADAKQEVAQRATAERHPRESRLFVFVALAPVCPPPVIQLDPPDCGVNRLSLRLQIN